jgi:hypothetical protein
MDGDGDDDRTPFPLCDVVISVSSSAADKGIDDRAC